MFSWAFTGFHGLHGVIINQLTGEWLINLAEVQLWYQGARLSTTSLHFELSTTFYSAENCNNGALYDFCHTGYDDFCPTLTVISDTVFDQIIVNNRQNCCQNRILGAQISATLNGGATWMTTFFEVVSSVYIFYPSKFRLIDCFKTKLCDLFCFKDCLWKKMLC